MSDFTDKDLRYHALHQWANYIETGIISLSAQDAQNMGKKFKALSVEQMKLVIRLRELADKELK
jgi:hypothetical protein